MTSSEKTLNLLYSFLFMILGYSLLWHWKIRSLYNFTGDEPHYLVYGKSLLLGNLNPTASYLEAQQNSTWVQWPAGDVQNFGHILNVGQNFLPAHSIGSSLFVIPAQLLTNQVMTLRFLIFLLVIPGVYQSLRFVNNLPKTALANKVFLSLAILTTPALLVHSNQIYPDTFVGAILLYGLHRVYLARKDSELVFLAVVFSLIPWFRMSFFATSIICVVMIAFRKPKLGFHIILIFLVNTIAILAYNITYYSTLQGPTPLSVDGPFNFVRMLSILLFDQRNGLLFSSPFLFLCFVVLWANAFRVLRIKPMVALNLLIVAVNIVLPSMSHQLGGESFAGRFTYVSTCALIPALLHSGIFNQSKGLKTFAISGTLINVLTLFSLGLGKSELLPREGKQSLLFDLNLGLNLLDTRTWPIGSMLLLSLLLAPLFVLLLRKVCHYQDHSVRESNRA